MCNLVHRLGICTGKFSDISIIGQSFEDVSELFVLLCFFV